jgi:ribonuclease T1
MVSELLLKVTKMKKLTKLLIPILVLIIAIGLLTSCDIYEGDILPTDTPSSINETPVSVDESGSYTSKEDVALYLYTYKRLPNNFITKSEARKLGWNGGSLEEYAPGKCIGGDRFGNYEGLLPEKEGRIFTECDIDTLGKSSRGAKRIVFSNDGLIYYTDDHYESFTLLYGEDNT